MGLNTKMWFVKVDTAGRGLVVININKAEIILIVFLID